jgi:hypothetical protein
MVIRYSQTGRINDETRAKTGCIIGDRKIRVDEGPLGLDLNDGLFGSFEITNCASLRRLGNLGFLCNLNRLSRLSWRWRLGRRWLICGATRTTCQTNNQHKNRHPDKRLEQFHIHFILLMVRYEKLTIWEKSSPCPKTKASPGSIS